MRELLKLVIGFLPWIAFGILAGPSILSLEIAMGTCLGLTLIIGFRELKKGFILTWGTVIFFAFGLYMVISEDNMWYVRHLAVLVPATLAAIAWVSLLLGKPFVLQYAKESADPAIWEKPGFIAVCRHLTIVWGSLFIFSTLVALAKYLHLGGPGWLYSVLSSGPTLFGVAYTEWYKKRKQAEGRRLALQNS
ncbi:hypothetical protein [Pseudodesulfovibrio indicus]|uniref:hypothetical protein n=1 Tax=Pseudodesulfovibrio indicus TaxID=1716143 RepID=UPI00292D9771|nr:hypothetical protein [Pseudodesulfovibrio indicus]